MNYYIPFHQHMNYLSKDTLSIILSFLNKHDILRLTLVSKTINHNISLIFLDKLSNCAAQAYFQYSMLQKKCAFCIADVDARFCCLTCTRKVCLRCLKSPKGCYCGRYGVSLCKKCIKTHVCYNDKRFY